LHGHQRHAQEAFGLRFDIIDGFGQDHAAQFFSFGFSRINTKWVASATATGVDLRLNNPNWAAELLRGFYRFLYGERGDAAWHWYTELTQDFLALVLMDFHKVS
jgi:hypothetical protein